MRHSSLTVSEEARYTLAGLAAEHADRGVPRLKELDAASLTVGHPENDRRGPQRAKGHPAPGGEPAADGTARRRYGAGGRSLGDGRTKLQTGAKTNGRTSIGRLRSTTGSSTQS